MNQNRIEEIRQIIDDIEQEISCLKNDLNRLVEQIDSLDLPRE